MPHDEAAQREHLNEVEEDLRRSLEWGFWVQASSIGVVVIGTIVVVAHRTSRSLRR